MSVQKTIDALQDLRFNEVSEDFVERTCSFEFTEDPEFDLTFTENSNRILVKFLNSLRVLQDAACQKSVWTIFDKESIDSRRLQVWVYYVLHHGLLKSATFCEKERALLAASLCFLLLKEPGGHGYQFFHEIIFEKSMSALKMAARANCTDPKRKKLTQAQPQKRSRAQGKTSSSQPGVDDENDDEVNEEILTAQQSVDLIGHLTIALKDLCRLVRVFSLKDRPAVLKNTVEALVQVTKHFGETPFPTLHSDIEEMFLPDQLAYKALEMFVNVKHGEPNKLAVLVLRLLMTTMTMRYAVSASGGSTVPRIFVKRSNGAVVLLNAIYDDHKEKVEDAVKVLMQNLVAQCPDRNEIKGHVSEIVSAFVYKMPIMWFAKFVEWLTRFVQHTRIGYRVGSLFVIGLLLNQPQRVFVDAEEVSDQLQNCITHKYLLQNVIYVITDVAPTVRSRALAVLCDVMNKQVVSPAVFAELIQGPEALTSPDRENRDPAVPGVTPLEQPVRKSTVTPLVTPATLHSVQAPSQYMYPSNIVNDLLPLLGQRCSEEKVVVRRSAVQALEVAICRGFVAATKWSISMLKSRCRDPLLSVRKLAIQSMTSVLLAHPDNPIVQRSWMKSILPAIQDNETSIQEKASQLLEEIILSGVLGTSTKETLAWSLLGYLATEKGDKLRIYLQRAVKLWDQQGKLTKQILQKIAQHIKDGTKKTCAWMLMRMVTLFFVDAATSSAVISSWKEEEEENNIISLKMDIISCVGQVASKMNKTDKDNTLTKLRNDIEKHKTPIQLIGFHFEAIQRIFDSQHDDVINAKKPMDNWCKKLLEASTNWLSDVVLTSSSTSYNEDLLLRHLFVVGDAAQRSPKNVPKRLLLSMQALLTSPTDIDDAVPSSQGLTQPLSQFRNSGIPSAIRAHCILNLGRICFQNEQLAKKVVPAMARELDTCEDVATRNNVLLVLTDLCVLQTQLVDTHLSDMATCLGDESALIRKHSVILISSLLRKEYVKWRGTLLFKFLHAVCDKDKKIRSLAKYCLLDQLLRGTSVAGDLFFRNFVACIFYFNAYNDHNVHKFVRNEREKRLFNVEGGEGLNKRMEIYKFLLENMEDEHRINLTGKLCSDILESFVEATIPLNDSTRHLLTDTLAVLCCKEIRLKCLKSKDAESELEEEVMSTQAERNAAVNVMQAKVKQKIVSQVVKRNLVENIIPIIIALKNMLLEMKSPLVQDVMLYLKEVTQEYRAEVQFILSADKQLASEIEFDLKRFEREQEEMKKKNLPQPTIPSAPNSRRNSVAESPGIGSPAPSGSPARVLHTPQGVAAGTITPASVRRRNRPMNVQAILNSARKTLRDVNNSPRPFTPHRDPKPPSVVPSTPAIHSSSDSSGTLRAASTPTHVNEQNITFAKDISAIVTSPFATRFAETKKQNLILLPHPEKPPPPETWNVTSPSPRRTNRSRISSRK